MLSPFSVTLLFSALIEPLIYSILFRLAFKFGIGLKNRVRSCALCLPACHLLARTSHNDPAQWCTSTQTQVRTHTDADACTHADADARIQTQVHAYRRRCAHRRRCTHMEAGAHAHRRRCTRTHANTPRHRSYFWKNNPSVSVLHVCSLYSLAFSTLCDPLSLQNLRLWIFPASQTLSTLGVVCPRPSGFTFHLPTRKQKRTTLTWGSSQVPHVRT